MHRHDEAERGRFAAYALYRRSAEATTVRAAATDLLTGHPQRSVVVLGDLNDEVEAATTQIVNGPPGSEIGTTSFDRPDNGDAQRLWNLAPRIPAEQRFSRIYRGRQELIDHIFVSHALVGKIAQDHVTTDAAGPTPSIDDDPTQRRSAPGSDHRPVLASIDLCVAKAASHITRRWPEWITVRVEALPQSGCLTGTFALHRRLLGLLRRAIERVRVLHEEDGLVASQAMRARCTGPATSPTFLSTSRISGSGRAAPVEAEAPGVVTTVAAARRLANAQGPGDTEGDPRRTPDFSPAVSSAITGAFQRWRLYTVITF